MLFICVLRMFNITYCMCTHVHLYTIITCIDDRTTYMCSCLLLVIYMCHMSLAGYASALVHGYVDTAMLQICLCHCLCHIISLQAVSRDCYLWSLTKWNLNIHHPFPFDMHQPTQRLRPRWMSIGREKQHNQQTGSQKQKHRIYR